jgi:hypothetical protein
MSRDASVLVAWAGGEHLFKLGIGQLIKLQEACDCGPMQHLARLRDGTWRVADVVEPIRWGLVGGGMDVAEANRLIKQYVHDTPLAQHALPAQAILIAALVGAPDEPVEDKSSPKAEAATDSQTGN